MITERDSERFWRHVRVGGEDDCWPYLSAKNSSGYGFFYLDGQNRGAHRVSFLIAHGRWPTPCGLHRCDCRPCVNPAHIFEGTIADNVADCVRKGRHAHGTALGAAIAKNTPRGEVHPAAKLTWEAVTELRALAGAGWTISALSRRFGITRRTVRQAVAYETWRPAAEVAA